MRIILSPAIVGRWRHGLTDRIGAALVAAAGGLRHGAASAARPLPTSALPPSPDSPLVKLVQASTPPGDEGLSGFRLMPAGFYSLDARVELAKRATRSLDIQYYQINNDKTGHLLLRNVRDAAKRGVRVRLIVDDLYTIGGDELFIGLAAFPNVEVRLFNPFCCGRDGLVDQVRRPRCPTSPSQPPDAQQAVHRRQRRSSIAGGRNIADEYFMRSMTDNFVDMDALIVGAVVPQLVNIFDSYWNSRHVFPVRDVITDLAHGRAASRSASTQLVDEGDQMMALVLPPIDILGYGPDQRRHRGRPARACIGARRPRSPIRRRRSPR